MFDPLRGARSVAGGCVDAESLGLVI